MEKANPALRRVEKRNYRMDETQCLRMIRASLAPSTGCTEPAAIALNAATARKAARGTVTQVTARLDAYLFKNAMGVGIPGADERGVDLCVALGITAGDADAGMNALHTVTAEQLEQIREHDSRRLEQMTFYSTTQDCLRGFLLHYFGEAAPKKCGNCSCCLAAEQEAQLQVEYARRRAAQSADRLEKPRRAKPAAAGSLSEADEKLLNALYAVRKRLAGKQNLPAFMVFNDATLREMAEKKPMSIDELLNISGVGEKKAARYGNAFLRVIEDAVGSRE